MINTYKIVRLTNEINKIIEATAVENEQKEQIMQLHMAVEKLCVNLLEETPDKKVIDIVKKALKANVADKKGCVDALIYLWVKLYWEGECSGEEPSNYAKKAKEAIDECFLQHKAIIDAIQGCSTII